MASTHFTLAEAAQHLPDLLDRAAAGEEIYIDRPGDDLYELRVRKTLRPPESSRHFDSSADATLARLLKREAADGPSRMGSDYANDMEKVLASRGPKDSSKWD